MPGLLGLNNMKHNDYVNVLVQILSRVAPIRNMFLQPSNFNDSLAPLTTRFGELLRKMWNPRNFKGQVGSFTWNGMQTHALPSDDIMNLPILWQTVHTFLLANHSSCQDEPVRTLTEAACTVTYHVTSHEWWK